MHRNLLHLALKIPSQEGCKIIVWTMYHIHRCKDTNKRARNIKLERIFFTTSESIFGFLLKDTNIRAQSGALASIVTTTRYNSVACNERNFSFSEERALTPLTLVPSKSQACLKISYHKQNYSMFHHKNTNMTNTVTPFSRKKPPFTFWQIVFNCYLL